MKYFSMNELTASVTAAKLGINNIPDHNSSLRLKDLVESVLDPVREAFGAPLFVNSGFRCAALNKAVKGASNSQHLYGEAADIRAARLPGESQKQANRRLFNLIHSLVKLGKITVGQLIDEYDFSWVHVSIPRLGENPKINDIRHLGN